MTNQLVLTQMALRGALTLLTSLSASAYHQHNNTNQGTNTGDCRDVLLQDTYHTTNSRVITSNYFEFTKKSFENIRDEYSRLSRGGQVAAIVYGIPIGAGYNDESLRALYQNTKEHFERLSRGEYSENDFFNSIIRVTRPDQVDAWIKCKELQAGGFQNPITHSIERTGNSNEVQIILKYKKPNTRLSVLNPAFRKLDQINIKPNQTNNKDRTFEQQLADDWQLPANCAGPDTLTALGAFTIEKPNVSAAISLDFDNFGNYLIVILPPQPTEPPPQHWCELHIYAAKSTDLRYNVANFMELTSVSMNNPSEPVGWTQNFGGPIKVFDLESEGHRYLLGTFRFITPHTTGAFGSELVLQTQFVKDGGTRNLVDKTVGVLPFVIQPEQSETARLGQVKTVLPGGADGALFALEAEWVLCK